MAISRNAAHQGHALSTDVGTVSIDVQDARTIYVRAALDGEHGIHPDAGQPLEAGRGCQLSLRAHFKLTPKGWQPRPGFVTAHRLDQNRHREPSPKQVRTATDAVIRALLTWTALPALLTSAQLEANEDEAGKRDELARELRKVADHLELEAVALRDGGRVTHREHRLSSRSSQRVDQVETAAGALLEPCPEPPAIYGASRYGLAHVTSNEEHN